MSIGVKAKQLGGELREKAKELGQKVEAKALEAQGKLQDKLFDGKLGQVIGGNHSDFTDKVVSKLNLSAFKDAPPPPVLTRPVVMIPGLTMHASSYDPLARHLAGEPKNGKEAVYVLADGKFHQGAVDGPVMTDAQVKATKMFQVQFRDVRGEPKEKAPQIAQAMKAIEQATGAPQLDVVAHSAGCTDFQLYLDQRSPAEQAAVKFDQVVFLGPVTQGTFMGNVGDAIGGVVGLDEAGTALELNSRLVKDLNTRWDAQRAQVGGAVSIIGVSGAPTVDTTGVHTGDGFVTARTLGRPNAELVVLRGADPTPVAHLLEVGYSGVIAEVQARLARD